MASLLEKIFGSGSNPYNKAQGYLEQVPDVLKQYLSPYSQMGQQATQQYQGQVGKLGTPGGATDILRQLGGGFQSSPGYQFQVDEAKKGLDRLSAAQGTFGSPEQSAALSKLIMNLANQDYYNYLNSATGLYGQGLSGLGNLSQMGLNASSNLGQDLATSLQNQGQLAFAGQQYQNQLPLQYLQGIGSLAGTLGGFLKKPETNNFFGF
jgi:hypothetical protein